jgi:GNAT superfamily N-acetyltransferase
VIRVFNEFVAPLYSPEGVQGFLSYGADPDQIRERLPAHRLLLVAELQGRIVGAIEIRHCDHISLFFVNGESQRNGMGRELWHKALDTCLASRPDLAKITVHSSPNAVEAYQRLGFLVEEPEQTMDGIRFVPMALTVTDIAGSQRTHKPASRDTRPDQRWVLLRSSHTTGLPALHAKCVLWFSLRTVQVTTCRRTARAAASVRLATPSLRMILVTWNRTVDGLITRCSATLALLCPSTSKASTLSSLCVKW